MEGMRWAHAGLAGYEWWETDGLEGVQLKSDGI